MRMGASLPEVQLAIFLDASLRITAPVLFFVTPSFSPLTESTGARRDDAQKGRYDATHSFPRSSPDHHNADGGNARFRFGAPLRQ
jgi:hypothetical protein